MRKNINKAEPPKGGFFIFRERKGSQRNGTDLAHCRQGWASLPRVAVSGQGSQAVLEVTLGATGSFNWEYDADSSIYRLSSIPPPHRLAVYYSRNVRVQTGSLHCTVASTS